MGGVLVLALLCADTSVEKLKAYIDGCKDAQKVGLVAAMEEAEAAIKAAKIAKISPRAPQPVTRIDKPKGKVAYLFQTEGERERFIKKQDDVRWKAKFAIERMDKGLVRWKYLPAKPEVGDIGILERTSEPIRVNTIGLPSTRARDEHAMIVAAQLAAETARAYGRIVHIVGDRECLVYHKGSFFWLLDLNVKGRKKGDTVIVDHVFEVVRTQELMAAGMGGEAPVLRPLGYLPFRVVGDDERELSTAEIR